MNTLNTIATASVIIGFVSFFIILIDILAGNKQHMMVMNFVWPITGLYAGPLALIAYYSIGRKSTHKYMMKMSDKQQPHHGKEDHMHYDGSMHNMKDMKMPQKPFWQSVVTGALHCGSGCTLGDIMAEILLLFTTVTLFGSTLYGTWLIDFIFAFVLGIVFQYYAIKPMKNLSPKEGLTAALKADALSLTSWQIGMYGGMAIAMFLIFKRRLEATEMLFWFVMQGAMILGFLTAFPVNWWLIKSGIKEKM